MKRPSTCTLAAACVLLCASLSLAHVERESEEIAALLDLTPGKIVADVGAGDGAFGEAMARRVGETGHVFINEIDAGELTKIRERVESSDLHNMTVIEGTVEDTRLGDDCCEAILLRLVYHHASHQEALRDSLLRALVPGGRLLVIETHQPNHGIAPDQLIEEITVGGFELVSRHPDWHGDDSDQYAVLFKRPASSF